MEKYVFLSECSTDWSPDAIEGGFFKLNKSFGSTEIAKIHDPAGGTVTEMPTAVPSPFARFDLVKTAFKNIAETKKLKAEKIGNNIIASTFDERLVSHTLDLAEIIFHYAEYKKYLEILTWDRETQLAELENSKNKSHQRLAKSLKLYLEQDTTAYNFHKDMKIHIFKYDGIVIGSTSTVTLFCPSANIAELSNLNIILPDGRIAFSENYKPLNERDEEFQNWMYYLVLNIHWKRDDKKCEWIDSIWNYYVKVYGAKLESSNLKSSDTAKTEYESNYAVLDTKNGVEGGNSYVKILGVKLNVHKSSINWNNSDFCIKISEDKNKKIKIQTNDQIPLVLENGVNHDDWIYAKGKFDPNCDVPSYVPNTTWKSKRKMPGLSIEGHYITVSDFLEPYLVRTVYPIHSKHFFVADKTDANSKSYLLPLTKDFFEFFTVDDLKNGGNGKPIISIKPNENGNVEVILKIPVKNPEKKEGGGYITLKRTYKEKNEEPNEKIEDGGIIVERRFGITIFPFVKPKGKAYVNYRVQLVDSNTDLQNSNYSLAFYNQSDMNKKLPIDEPKHRMNKKSGLCTSDYYKLNGFEVTSERFDVINNDFDIIQLTVTNPQVNALIIPILPEFQPGADTYKFAVDFGTTNTYIAYKKGEEGQIFPFNNIENSEDDILIATLFDESNSKTEENLRTFGAFDVMDFIDKEFVPRKIGRKDREFSSGQIVFEFPQRTAIAYNKDMQKDAWEKGCVALAESNIPFRYEKGSQKGDNVDTNMKWSSSKDNFEITKKEFQMRAYIEQIMMLLQTKVLANRGNLLNTHLIWFYPNSMTPSNIVKLEKLWRQQFSNYFNKGIEISTESPRLTAIKESLAPFYSQQNDAVNKGAVASIDIGGGTTDAAIFVDGNLKGNASFKFAGNALFGDGYIARNARENGFVLEFEKIYKELLKKNRGKAILDSLLESNKASDINAFFFSVENSIGYWTGEQVSPAAYSYSTKLESENRLKFLILYFYVSLIYHVGQILKNIKTDDGNAVKLRYVMFSGTGSKILKVLTSSAYLTKFTKKVFEDMKLDSEFLEIRFVDKPKEATCNGGLLATQDKIEADMKASEQALQYIHTCIKGKEFQPIKYKDYIENSEDIKESLAEFHEFFFKLNQGNFKFSDYFGIESKVIEYVEKNYKSLLEKYVEHSIEKNREIEGIKLEDSVSETPFFMPLKSIILDLSKKIVTDL